MRYGQRGRFRHAADAAHRGRSAGDFSAKTVHVPIIQTDDRKGIAEILVKKIGDRPGKK